MGARRSLVFALVGALLGGSAGAARADESPEGLTAPSPNRVELVSLETRGYGVAPVVPRFVTDRLRARFSQAGHRVWDGRASQTLEARVGLPHPPSVSALERAAKVALVGRIAYSQVWAEKGRYVVQLVFVSLDGAPPVIARVAADAENLGEAVDALVDERVPPTSEFDREAARRATEPAPTQPRPAPRAPAPSDKRPSHRGAIAIVAGPGIGAGEDRFHTFNLRARLELRITGSFSASVVAGYANLPGGGQRVHNAPVLGQLEYKVAIADLERLRIPIRFAMGYIPYNGPVARASAGLNYEVADAWEIGADLIAPTFLNTPSDPYLTFEISVEVVRRFGAVSPRR